MVVYNTTAMQNVAGTKVPTTLVLLLMYSLHEGFGGVSVWLLLCKLENFHRTNTHSVQYLQHTHPLLHGFTTSAPRRCQLDVSAPTSAPTLHTNDDKSIHIDVYANTKRTQRSILVGQHHCSMVCRRPGGWLHFSLAYAAQYSAND